MNNQKAIDFQGNSIFSPSQSPEYGDFILGYKVHIDLVLGLAGVFSLVELPKGSRIIINDNPVTVTHIQPVSLLYFPDKKKISIYWDSFKIYHEHECCLDRINEVAKVRTILKSFGIKDSLDAYMQFKPIHKQDGKAIKINLWMNHFTDCIDLLKFK